MEIAVGNIVGRRSIGDEWGKRQLWNEQKEKCDERGTFILWYFMNFFDLEMLRERLVGNLLRHARMYSIIRRPYRSLYIVQIYHGSNVEIVVLPFKCFELC